MKKIIQAIISIKFTIILLVLFIISIGTATFIEERFDTVTAKILIYNARWLELIYLLLVINLIGNIKRYKLFRRERASGMIFHLAFIIIIIGAGITRYFGISGVMNIREGESSDLIYSSDPYFQVKTVINNQPYSYDRILYLSEVTNNSFSKKIDLAEKGVLEIKYKDFIKNAVEIIETNIDEGLDILELAVVKEGMMEVIFLKEGEIKDVGEISIAFNNPGRVDAINIIYESDKLTMVSPVDIISMKMMTSETDTIFKDTSTEFREKYIYRTGNSMFVFKTWHRNARLQLVRGIENGSDIDALILDIFLNNRKYEVPVFGSTEHISEFQEVNLDGVILRFAYGSKEMRLPFSLHLDDFILERYAGSMSPSSFESKITLVDERKNIQEKHRIFMNRVLDYDGYRFFQSSYNEDEQGTFLSVNQDFYGTWISYAGYFLLAAGFILTLINRNSRYHYLRRKIQESGIARKATIIILLILGSGGISHAQYSAGETISKDHTDKLGTLLVQTYNGRFQPLNTLAIDVVHKVSRKDYFKVPQKGKMDCMQVFTDMMLDPEFWQQQELIYVREKSVREILGITGKHASFNDFITRQSQYKLSEYIDIAFRKKRSEQNKFDKEIIKVDERLNICMMIFEGSLLKIFPEPESVDNKWISPVDTLAFTPVCSTIDVNINEEDLLSGLVSYNNLLQSYFRSVMEAIKSGDYSKSDRILGYIEAIQSSSNSSDSFPSRLKIKLEIQYNQLKIFIKLRNIYGIIGLILLILALIENLGSGRRKHIHSFIILLIVLLGLAFLFHTYGLGLRWYLSGHAPWSNGYEALLLIAWGGLLAGFIYLRQSRITLASAALLGFFILMTAGHSSYDPQLTNLQPVLKSYWLILHVAVITISYGFLGSGFLLGIINLIICLFRAPANSEKIDRTAEELTNINEMNLTIGLVLVTIGTFLGAIWANESWGRYWGWDAKETWALIIVITYAIILHLRLIPGLKYGYIFNAASIIGFGSVIMTFIGVNYYLSKGLHSYAAGGTPAFPYWAWGIIFSILILIVWAGVKENSFLKTRINGKK